VLGENGEESTISRDRAYFRGNSEGRGDWSKIGAYS